MGAFLIKWLMTTNSAKAVAFAGGSGGMLLLVLQLHGDVKAEIEKQEEKLNERVELVLNPVRVEIKNLNENQKETKIMVRDIHNYLLKNKK